MLPPRKLVRKVRALIDPHTMPSHLNADSVAIAATLVKGDKYGWIPTEHTRAGVHPIGVDRMDVGL